jgi:uncharacterized caspase-like protein
MGATDSYGYALGSCSSFSESSGPQYGEWWNNWNCNFSAAYNPTVTYAVVVGVANYKNLGPSTGDLRYTLNDAKNFRDVLLSGTMGHVRPENIDILLDEKASKKNILDAMARQFSKADANDRVIFFFSGHGTKTFFVPYDVSVYNPETRLYFHEIKRIYQRSAAAYKLLIADACYSGALKGSGSDARKPQNDSRNAEVQVAIMLSSTGNEISVEYPSLNQGVFSHFLIQGLKGAADGNKDKRVTIEELYYYVRDNTYAFVKKRTGKSQRPILFGKFERNMVMSRLAP